MWWKVHNTSLSKYVSATWIGFRNHPSPKILAVCTHLPVPWISLPLSSLEFIRCYYYLSRTSEKSRVLKSYKCIYSSSNPFLGHNISVFRRTSLPPVLPLGTSVSLLSSHSVSGGSPVSEPQICYLECRFPGPGPYPHLFISWVEELRELHFYQTTQMIPEAAQDTPPGPFFCWLSHCLGQQRAPTSPHLARVAWILPAGGAASHRSQEVCIV